MATTNHALTQNDWTKIADYDGSRNYVRISDHSLSGSTIRFAFTNNPYSYKFLTDTDIDISTILAAPNSFASATTGAIEIGFRMTAGAGAHALFSVGDTSSTPNLQISITGGDLLSATLTSAAGVRWTVTSPSALVADKWYYATLVHDGVSPKLYFGDKNKGEITVTTVSTALTEFLADLTGLDNAFIGTQSLSGTGKSLYFDGFIDYVRILQGTMSSQVAQYRFNEGTGTTLTDHYEHGDNGTITPGAGGGGWDLTEKEKGENLVVNADGYAEVSNDENPYIRLPIWAFTAGASDSVTLLQKNNFM